MNVERCTGHDSLDYSQSLPHSFSHQLNGLTNRITSPRFGETLALPQVFAVAIPFWTTF
jgi:hypothetical protein